VGDECFEVSQGLSFGSSIPVLHSTSSSNGMQPCRGLSSSEVLDVSEVDLKLTSNILFLLFVVHMAYLP
jgi:hypothetical protein